MEWFFGPFLLIWAILGLVALVVWIWALVDCVQVPDDSMYQSGNKLIWVLIIVFLSWIGAILYFLIGRPQRGAARRPEPPAVPPAPPGTGP
jgi:hypothetical protein